MGVQCECRFVFTKGLTGMCRKYVSFCLKCVRAHLIINNLCKLSFVKITSRKYADELNPVKIINLSGMDPERLCQNDVSEMVNDRDRHFVFAIQVYFPGLVRQIKFFVL